MPSPEAPVILARGLSKRFGPLTAVDGLDLRVQRAEVFGFLGPKFLAGYEHDGCLRQPLRRIARQDRDGRAHQPGS